MQLVCVSRGTYGGGRQLAETLARKLGFECLSREKLSDAATDAGIAVGKLELAVLHRRPLNEWMNVEKERYKAFVAHTLAEGALKGGLVYHGRHAHVHLPGVSHVLRVRAIMDAEMRTALTMQRLSIPLDKAQRYNEQVDEDRSRWVRTLYNVDWQDPSQYDMVVNLSRVHIDNAASALLTMAQLPEFQGAPADRRELGDIAVATRCRLAIGADPRTRLADVQVKARAGRVLLTYLPRQQHLAGFLPQLLATIPGVDEVVCTMASTNILWVQERFTTGGEALSQVLDVASRWGAAVELVQLSDEAAPDTALAPVEPALLGAAEQAADRAHHGGILDDDAAVDTGYGDEGTNQTMQQLISSGRVGGYRRVHGGAKALVASVDRSATYSLAVVGEVFLDKAAPVRKRLARDLVRYLNDKLKVPVVDISELKTHFAIDAKHWLRLVLYGGAAASIAVGVLTHQREVLDFLTAEGTLHRAVAAACLFVCAPLFAYVHGNFAHHLLRLFRFE